MKVCTRCNAQLSDNAAFCNVCGANVGQGANQSQQGQNQAQYQQQYTPQYTNPYDHTREFDQKDISANKVLAMMVYLMGTMGIIIALLAGSKSPYLSFHVRESLKFTVVSILMSIITVVLCWTFIVPIAAGVMSIIFFVIKIICFFQICQGKAVEPAIIRSLTFLK